MRTVRDGVEVHPGLDADHRPESAAAPEPAPEPEPEFADDTPVPTTLDGVPVDAAPAAPATPAAVKKPVGKSGKKG